MMIFKPLYRTILWLAVFNLSLISAKDTTAEVLLTDVSCNDLVFATVAGTYSVSSEPVWLMRELEKLSLIVDDQLEEWKSRYQSRFYRGDTPRTIALEIEKLKAHYLSKENHHAQCKLSLIIHGYISDADVQKLRLMLADFKRPPYLQVTLSSEGGEVLAAIQIGRIMREHYATVDVGLSSYGQKQLGQRLKTLDNMLKYKEWLSENAAAAGTKDYLKVQEALTLLSSGYVGNISREEAEQIAKIYRANNRGSGCYSACVLLYVGGISRSLEYNPNTGGSYPLGVHQHFLPNSFLNDLDVDTAVTILRELSAEILQYFEVMGVPRELFDLAMTVEKDDLLLLTEKELVSTIPFAQPEYAAVIPDKVEQAQQYPPKYFKELTDELSDPVSMSEFMKAIDKERFRSSDITAWAVFNSYHIESAQSSQKYWRDLIK